MESKANGFSNAGKQANGVVHAKKQVNGAMEINGHTAGPETCTMPSKTVPIDRLKSWLENGHSNEVAIQSPDPFEDKLEPIAVIGMSFRGPGDATSPNALWNVLEQRQSAMSKIPDNRFNSDGFCELSNPRTGLLNVRGGHFMTEDLAAFDAPFFSISATEAGQIDPQQRWLLESTYEALEDAGIPLHQTSGSKTAVYVGSFTRDFEHLIARDVDLRAPYRATGVGMGMLANRLSWYFNWSGPSLAIDSACSSSLATVHLACRDLYAGDASMAIAGGCNIITDPIQFTVLTDMGFLSPDDKCKSFDAKANGYSRGEGFGLVVLKRLKDALRDNDMIRGVIRATGINQDAKTPSLTQPSSDAQEELIRSTYKAGGLSMAQTRFFEAHGTGTSVGDPLEAKAIYRAFQEQLANHPLHVGAVKSNIGHLEGASGVTGLIKSILAFEKGVIPPNIWLDEINPKIPAKSWNLVFPTNAKPWPISGLRRASINSFGFGGTNAHCVVDDAYHYLKSRNLIGNHNTRPTPPKPEELNELRSDANGHANGTREDLPSYALMTWSAPDVGGITRLAKLYKEFLQSKAPISAEYAKKLAYTLSERRSQFPWRAFKVVSIGGAMDGTNLETTSTPVRSLKQPKLCYLFSGQGAQSAQMSLELRMYPVFKRSLENADKYYLELGSSWSLTGELEKEKALSRIDDPEVSQPACTALQLALIDLVTDWGLLPSVVIGHSSGEIAAAFATGAISREAALKIAYFRGIAAATSIQMSHSQQGMMAANLSKDVALKYIQDLDYADGDLTVGCVNSPTNVTVSGDAQALDKLQVELDRKGIFCRKLKVEAAYHSEHMNHGAMAYRLLMGTISPGEKRRKEAVMVSSVTGQRIDASELRKAEYWVRNMLEPVNFSDAAMTVRSAQSGSSRKMSSVKSVLAVDHFVEIGPHPVLRAAIKEVFDKVSQDKLSYTTLQDRRYPAVWSVLRAVGELYCLGAPVSIRKPNDITSDTESMLTDLPSYPFDHSKHYWKEGRVGKEFRLRTELPHELLGSPTMNWNPQEASWRNMFAISERPWILDHRIQGAVVFPATGILALAIEIARRQLGVGRPIRAYRLKDTVIAKATIIPSDPGSIEWQTYFRPQTTSAGETIIWGDFSLHIYEDSRWVEACKGAVGIELDDASKDLSDADFAGQNAMEIETVVHEGSSRCPDSITPETFYTTAKEMGYDYGPSFQGMKSINLSPIAHEATAMIDLLHWKSKVESIPSQAYVVHPAALDTMFQLMSVACTEAGPTRSEPMLPVQIRDMWISNEFNSNMDIAEALVHASLDSQGLRAAECSLNAIDRASNKPILTGQFQGAFMHSQEKDSSMQLGHDRSDLCYRLEWKPDAKFLKPDAFHSMYCQLRSDDQTVLEFQDIECLVSLVCQQVQDAELPVELLTTKPHLAKYHGWMRRAAETHKQTSYQHVGDQDYDNLLERVEASSVTGKAVARVARAMQGILDGKVDPLSLLFQDDLLSEYYTEAYGLADLYAQGAHYIDLLAHANPKLNILEIGAGTGSATASALKALNVDGQHAARYGNFNFTDVSPSFFEEARNKFAEYVGSMTFSVLDIEKDPAEQGLEDGTYDLIIASNVLHATSSMKRTLDHTRKLMKPGGTLLMYEATRTDALGLAFVFGILPGWWLSSEPTRSFGPLLGQQEWNKRLLASGFTGVDTELRSHTDAKAHMMSAMISHAAPMDDFWLANENVTIVIQETPAQHNFAKELQSGLNTIGIVDSKIITTTDLTCGSEDGMRHTNVLFLPDLERPVLLDLDEAGFKALKQLLSESKTIIWPTCQGDDPSGPSVGSMALGFLRAIRLEHEKLKAVTLSLEHATSAETTSHYILQCLRRALTDDPERLELEYEERDGILGTSRVGTDQPLNADMSRQLFAQAPQLAKIGDGSRPLELTIGVPGLLDTLHFRTDPIALTPVAENEIELKVVCAGLNFKDLLAALGQLNLPSIGLEASGIVVQSGPHTPFKPGDRVVCQSLSAFRSYVRCKAHHAVKLPDSIDFRSAAALPVIYTTAYYSLFYLARIRRGESVLIHSAAGGLGQALVQLAQLEGAEIFATVGTEAKREFLIKRYGLARDHIFSSRTSAFLYGIRHATAGRGVDVVVNSLSGEKLQASWECIAPSGRFIEAGKKDIETYQSLPLKKFTDNAMFCSVDLTKIIQDRDPALAVELLNKIVDLLADGKIFVPEDFRVYNGSQIEHAFRLMQGGNVMGKAVFEFGENDIAPIIPDTTPKYEFDRNATYVISGGLGGLGKSAARWMAKRGARNLILFSRQEPSSYTAKTITLFDELAQDGVNVLTPPCDVADLERLKSVLSECCQTMPPIKGCLQASMVLRDETFQKMTLSNFNAAIKPKVQGSWNLHHLLPQDLDFFILLSSAVGIFGNHGQSNYAAGNTYQDALAHHRVSRGQKAVSLDLGVMKDIGYVAEQADAGYILSSNIGVMEAEFLALLEYHCDPSLPVFSRHDAQVVMGVETPTQLRKRGVENPFWLNRPMFSTLFALDAHGDRGDQGGAGGAVVDYVALLVQAANMADASEVVCEALINKLSRFIGVDVGDVDVGKPLHAYGIDSLSAVELRNWFANVMKADVTVFDILGNNKIASLAETVAGRSKLIKEAVRKEDGGGMDE